MDEESGDLVKVDGDKIKPLADKFIQQLKEQNLMPPFTNSSVFVQSTGWNTKKYFGKYYADKTPFHLFLIQKKDEAIMFLPIQKFRATAQEFFLKYWKDTTVLNTRLIEYAKLSKEVDELYSKINQDFVKITQNNTLLHLAEKIINNVWNVSALAFFSITFDKDFCLQLLKEANARMSVERINAIWDTAITPVCNSFDTRRLIHLLTLISKNTNRNEIIEKCQYFYSAYHHIASMKETKTNLDKDFEEFDVTTAINKLNELKKEENNREKQHQKFKLTLSEDEHKLVDYIQKIIELRDVRKDVFAKALTVLYRIAQKMFQKARMPEKFIMYSAYTEIFGGINALTKLKHQIIKREKGFSSLVLYDGTIEFQQGCFDENKKKIDLFYEQQGNIKNVGEIKGQTGCSGKIKGTVCLIRSIKTEGKKFKDGCVLVTGMTRPEFVPFMKKAGAIVTDEGGITCHAAIVSRELKKPCIIGTKIATKILKDGDVVEVNANTGIVRKLK